MCAAARNNLNLRGQGRLDSSDTFWRSCCVPRTEVLVAHLALMSLSLSFAIGERHRKSSWQIHISASSCQNGEGRGRTLSKQDA